MGPRLGPCSPWTSGGQVLALPWITAAAQTAMSATNPLDQEQISLICAESAMAASEILYELSGRIFTGECGPVTIRPVSRPTDADTRAWPGSLSPSGWFSAWGAASSYGTSMPAVRSMYLSIEPPTIRLPYPVTEILQVLIDGVVIPGPYDPEINPTGEWELRDHKDLIRIRPTASFPPTERWGWPTSQVMDLPDSQQGTFSVTFTFGTPPPAAGKMAAVKLAEALALPQLGETTHYPSRTTAITRQGVTMQVASVIDLLKAGSLGIWEVDSFLDAINPKRLQRQAQVWSPDVGRNRRQATPTLPS